MFLGVTVTNGHQTGALRQGDAVLSRLWRSQVQSTDPPPSWPPPVHNGSVGLGDRRPGAVSSLPLVPTASPCLSLSYGFLTRTPSVAAGVARILYDPSFTNDLCKDPILRQGSEMNWGGGQEPAQNRGAHRCGGGISDAVYVVGQRSVSSVVLSHSQANLSPNLLINLARLVSAPGIPISASPVWC